MDKTRVALTAIICTAIVLISFSGGMQPIRKKTDTGFQMETVKTGDVTWACLKHGGEYIGCSTVETVK